MPSEIDTSHDDHCRLRGAWAGELLDPFIKPLPAFDEMLAS